MLYNRVLKLSVLFFMMFFVFGMNISAQKRDKSKGSRYSLEQAMSDNAQLSTAAFSGLAFITGTFGADTFLPPGKVADYFGFQYMRDIDAAEAGHNMNFLTYIANNVLDLLTTKQLNMFIDLAEEQDEQFQDLVKLRLPVIMAFRKHMEGDYPTGYNTLKEDAVIDQIIKVFELDGVLSYRRAEVFSELAASLTEKQKVTLATLQFGDSSTWPPKKKVLDKGTLPKGLNILVMTYASEFFSFYAGSETADVYFCPERHATYFGGFYMKDYPAMGNEDYFIPTELTGESGKIFVNEILNSSQQKLMNDITDVQREWLQGIAEIRTAISREFRGALAGGTIDRTEIMELSKKYGELDARISYLYADRFAQIKRTLSEKQMEELTTLRNQYVFPKGIYLYSTPSKTPDLGSLESFFTKES